MTKLFNMQLPNLYVYKLDIEGFNINKIVPRRESRRMGVE